MNEIAKIFYEKAQKEAVKSTLKAMMLPPNATLQQHQEIDQRVEQAAQYADYLINLAKAYNMDVRTLVFNLFGF